MDRKEVDGEHDDDGDQHLGHFATGPELIVQGPVGRVQPEIRFNYNFTKLLTILLADNVAKRMPLRV